MSNRRLLFSSTTILGVSTVCWFSILLIPQLVQSMDTGLNMMDAYMTVTKGMSKDGKKFLTRTVSKMRKIDSKDHAVLIRQINTACGDYIQLLYLSKFMDRRNRLTELEDLLTDAMMEFKQKGSQALGKLNGLCQSRGYQEYIIQQKAALYENEYEKWAENELAGQQCPAAALLKVLSVMKLEELMGIVHGMKKKKADHTNKVMAIEKLKKLCKARRKLLFHDEA